MTFEELRVLRALLREYERICDMFVLKPLTHQAYRDAADLESQPTEAKPPSTS